MADSSSSSEPSMQELPPLVEKDLTMESLTVFAAILTPILCVFILLTCYFRCKRSQRKAKERKERVLNFEKRQKKQTKIAISNLETEQNLKTEAHGLETERATKGDGIPFDDRCKEQDGQELTINN